MVKDESICVHCGRCAERCPVAAWDMAKVDLTDLAAKAVARPPVPMRAPAARMAR
jgi:ferredoxin